MCLELGSTSHKLGNVKKGPRSSFLICVKGFNIITLQGLEHQASSTRNPGIEFNKPCVHWYSLVSSSHNFGSIDYLGSTVAMACLDVPRGKV